MARAMRRRRRGIAILSVVGFADAVYMLAYHLGVLDSLSCPFFDKGCNAVGRSRQARHFGVPNALMGVLGYAVMTRLAVANLEQPSRALLLQRLCLAALAVGAVGSSAVLTWEQVAKVKAFCFWCLLSTTINLLILPLALLELRASARAARRAVDVDVR
jgi:uncharacterized membrane protein